MKKGMVVYLRLWQAMVDLRYTLRYLRYINRCHFTDLVEYHIVL